MDVGAKDEILPQKQIWHCQKSYLAIAPHSHGNITCGKGSHFSGTNAMIWFHVDFKL